MSFQDDIKQSKFKNVHQMAYLNLLYTSSYMMDKSKTILKPFGITHQQYNVLRILRGKNPGVCSADDIKEVMIDKSPDLTRLLTRLIEKELVTRCVCEENRRKIDISITSKGLKLIEDIDPVLTQFQDKQIKITDEEANELSRILDKLRS